MSTWTTHARVQGRPDQVLEVLTDPSAAMRWAPVPFDVDESRRLTEGSHARVRGQIAGISVTFDLAVHTARTDVLELTAAGPVVMHVMYRVEEEPGGSQIHAEVRVRRGGGVLNALVARLADGLFAAGALHAAVAAIARETEALDRAQPDAA